MEREQIDIISTVNAPAAVGAYSQAAGYGGLYFLSGQIGIDPENNELKQEFREQMDQILLNIEALLNEASLGRSDVIKTTVFLTDLKNFSCVNEAYECFFGNPFPARSCVEVSALPKDALVEIEVIAIRK